MVDQVFVTSARSQARVLAGLSGPMLLGLGSGISVSAGFGAFGFSVLLDGLHAFNTQPLWFSQFAITVFFYVLAGVWASVPLGVGTLPSLLLIGPMISFGAAMTPVDLNFTGNLLAFVVGLFCFALGISMAAAARFGPDGITALCLAAEKKTKLTIAQTNFLLNLTAIGLGVSLGGKFGPGTVIGLLLVPVLISHMLPRLRYLLVSVHPETCAAVEH